MGLTYGAAGLALGALFRNAGGVTTAVLLWTVVVTPALDLLTLQAHGGLALAYRLLPDANMLTLTRLYGTIINTGNQAVQVGSAAAAAVLALYVAAFLLLPIALIHRRDMT